MNASWAAPVCEVGNSIRPSASCLASGRATADTARARASEATATGRSMDGDLLRQCSPGGRGFKARGVQSTGGSKHGGFKARGVQSTGGSKHGGFKAQGVQSTGVQSTGVQSTGVQSTGVQSTGVQSTGGSKHGGFEARGFKARGVQSTGGSKHEGFKARRVKARGFKSSRVQSTRVQTRCSGSSGQCPRGVRSPVVSNDRAVEPPAETPGS